MKTFCKLVDFHCDVKKDYHCHSQFTSVLLWYQGVRIAYKEARGAGWILSKDKDICPNCR